MNYYSYDPKDGTIIPWHSSIDSGASYPADYFFTPRDLMAAKN